MPAVAKSSMFWLRCAAMNDPPFALGCSVGRAPAQFQKLLDKGMVYYDGEENPRAIVTNKGAAYIAKSKARIYKKRAERATDGE